MTHAPSPRPLRAAMSVAACLVALAGAAPAAAVAAGTPHRGSIERVAAFDHQVTGVTVSEDGRTFVNFPRWTEDAPVSVAEVLEGGRTRAYPNAHWNRWRNRLQDSRSPRDRFVCVQSVVADGRGSVWALDAGAPAQDRVVRGAPKLVQMDLATNQVVRVIPFGPDVAPQGSYLNDVRFSPDGRAAYITDSGASGAIVVVDLETGTARRTLDGDPSTQVDPTVTVSIGGEPLRRPDGRGVAFAADGITLSRDGATLTWQAIKGKTLYSIDTASLRDPALGPLQLRARVQVVGTNRVADGLFTDARGELLATAPERSAVTVRRGGRPVVLAQDARLDWPDTLAQRPDGDVLVTASRIPDMQWYRPDRPARLPTTLWRIRR